MKKKAAIIASVLIGVLSFGTAFADSIEVTEDSGTFDNAYLSENMDNTALDPALKTKFGTFSSMYSAVDAESSVTYKLPAGKVMMGAEIMIFRSSDADRYVIKYSNSAEGDEETVLGDDKAQSAFIADNDNKNGIVTDLFTTDAAAEMLRQKGADTIKVEFYPEEGSKMGVLLFGLYYSDAEFSGFFAGGESITDNGQIFPGTENIEIAFNARMTAKDGDIILKKNNGEIESEIGYDGAKILVRPAEGFKYGEEYGIVFSDDFLAKGIKNLPEKISFSMPKSDFEISGEVFDDNGEKCSAGFKIRNNTKNDQKALICFISYKDMMILDKKYISKDLPAGKATDVLTGEISSKDADEILVMVWDNMVNMRPLTKEIKK